MGNALPLLVVAGAAVYYFMQQQQQPQGPTTTDLLLMQLLQGNRPPSGAPGSTTPLPSSLPSIPAPSGPVAGIIGAVSAGVAALVYAIKEQGLFRGGWEGVTGNTRRDAFMAQFGNSLDILGKVLMDNVLVQPYYQNWEQAEAERVRLLTALNRADSDSKLNAAVDDIIAAFRRVGLTVVRGY